MHKFIQRAKKTSYLIELIDRHKRWKAEGGERLDDDEQDLASDLYVMCYSHELTQTAVLFDCRPSSGDPEELWDFETVRHASRSATIAHFNPTPEAEPPLIRENRGMARQDGSSDTFSIRLGSVPPASSSEYAFSIAKDKLPLSRPSATRTPTEFDRQATVRQEPTAGVGAAGSGVGQRTVQQEPSDEHKGYNDQHLPSYPFQGKVLQPKPGQVQLENNLPDTMVLDTVIFPAIGSVSCSTALCAFTILIHFILCAVLPARLLAGSASGS
jgi:serine/threonine-protein kinase 24/25/MST4